VVLLFGFRVRLRFVLSVMVVISQAYRQSFSVVLHDRGIQVRLQILKLVQLADHLLADRRHIGGNVGIARGRELD